MRQLTPGVRNVMHMRAAERAAAPDAGGARADLVGRDAAGRFVAGGANGGAAAMSRMKIGLSPEQKRWVEQEAVRRGVPKTVLVRELLDKALTGRGPFDPHAVRDVAPDGAVHDLVGLEGGGAAGDPHGTADASPVGDPARRRRAGGGARARVRGVGARSVSAGHRRRRRACARPRARAVHRSRRGRARGGVPRAGSPAYAVAERVAGDSARAAVGDPSAGASSAHTAHVPAGVGVSTARSAEHPAPAGAHLDGVPPGVALPGGMYADVVADGPESKSMVVSDGRVSAESGVLVMLPGARPGDPLRPVRVPLASYVSGQYGTAGGGFLSGLPGS